MDQNNLALLPKHTRFGIMLIARWVLRAALRVCGSGWPSSGGLTRCVQHQCASAEKRYGPCCMALRTAWQSSALTRYNASARSVGCVGRVSAKGAHGWVRPGCLTGGRHRRGCAPVVAGEGAAAARPGRAALAAAVGGHRSWCPVEAGRAVRFTDQPDPDGLVVNQARPLLDAPVPWRQLHRQRERGAVEHPARVWTCSWVGPASTPGMPAETAGCRACLLCGPKRGI